MDTAAKRRTSTQCLHVMETKARVTNKRTLCGHETISETGKNTPSHPLDSLTQLVYSQTQSG